MIKPVVAAPPQTPRPKLTDKERLDRQLGKHKPERAADGLPKASRPYEDARRRLGPASANYGPSASYTPASDGGCGGD